MRGLVGTICTFALLAPVPASFAQTRDHAGDARTSIPTSLTSLCRQPAALPDLAPEVDRRREQSQEMPERPMAMPAPIPAPIPAPMPRSAPPTPAVSVPVDMATSDDSGSSIIVTGARLERSTSDGAASVISTESSADSHMPGYPTLPPRPGPPPPQPQSGLLTAGGA